MIKTDTSQSLIYPDVFRTMTYDWYLYVHINFGENLFSIVPSIESPLQSALCKKGMFLVVVKNDPDDMFESADWKLQLERQYQIFVVWMKMTQFVSNKLTIIGKQLFSSYKTYFFCTFGRGVVVWVVATTPKNILALKLLSLKKSWVSWFAVHDFTFNNEVELANEQSCKKLDVIQLYNKQFKKCQYYLMLARIIKHTCKWL